MESFKPFLLGILLSLAATALLLLGLRWLRLNNHKRSGRRRRCHPVVCTVFHQLLHLDKLHDYHADLAQRYGAFRVSHFTRNYVYLVDPADVEHILRTNFANYSKGSYTYELVNDLLGDGIFAVDGGKWRQQRKLASFEFTTRNLREYSIGVFRRNATALALVISEAAASNRAVDIQDLFMKSTLDSIFKVGFGVELDTLSGSNKEGSRFAEAFDASGEVIVRRYFDFLWKIKRILNIGAEAELKEHLKVINDFVYKVIRSKTQQQISAPRDASVMRREDILSRFLAQKEECVEMDMKYLRDIVLNLVIAGRDTTAGTLSWFLYMLCKHPEVQEKVASEAAMATGLAAPSCTPMADFAAVVTEEVLDKMHYLHAALTETLRLYPAVPVDPKACLSDDTLPGGYDVRGGDLVSYAPYSMGRMKQLWGEDAEEFRPERWLDEKGVFQPESPFKFAAFQAGPRICLGKDFAYMQMKIFAAVLAHFFTFELRDADKQVTYRNTFTLPIDQGLHVRAFRRPLV
ncbi:hypothetical protein Taro_045448 [Colocasia esculenta]|uniref:Cytochrome P450 704C1 n=1 Tax=Colocasia esculenta TaxID=4460 RepID=A0A843X6J7_COLES|nr:hypothetical protein [Colocasia esculenta]